MIFPVSMEDAQMKMIFPVSMEHAQTKICRQ